MKVPSVLYPTSGQAKLWSLVYFAGGELSTFWHALTHPGISATVSFILVYLFTLMNLGAAVVVFILWKRYAAWYERRFPQRSKA